MTRGVIVDGNNLVFMLLSTKLLPTDEGVQRAVRILRKRMATAPVRLAIDQGTLHIADPAGTWSRSLSVDGVGATTQGTAPAAAGLLQPAAPAATVAPAADDDQQLRALCAALSGQPLQDRAACLAWLRAEVEAAEARKLALADAGGLRLVYSAPAVPGLRHPADARPQPKASAKKPKKAKAPRRRTVAPLPASADDWDW